MAVDLSHLNTRQQLFVEAIARGQSQTDAYIFAGYNLYNGTAGAASKLATKLSHEIAAKTSEIVALALPAPSPPPESLKLTPNRVIAGLLDLAENGKKESTRVNAWTQLGRSLGMFVDRSVVASFDAAKIIEAARAEGWDEEMTQRAVEAARGLLGVGDEAAT